MSDKAETVEETSEDQSTPPGMVLADKTSETSTPNVAGEEGEKMINVITTEPGTFGVGGIEKVGTKATIPVSKFSKNWMRPAELKDAKAIQANLKAKEKAKADAK